MKASVRLAGIMDNNPLEWATPPLMRDVLAEIDQMRRALTSARAFIEEDRRVFVECASVANDEQSFEDVDRSALEQYDALLAEIGAALAAEKGKE